MGFSLFTDLITPTKYDVPSAPQVDINKEQLDNTKSNAASFAGAKDLAGAFNDFMQQQLSKQLNTSVPEFQGLESQMANNLGSQLKGELTQSDLASSQRMSAAGALGRGIAGSPAGMAFSARNIGARQFDIQRQAQAQVPGYLQAITGIKRSPLFDFSNSFMSAQQRIGVQMANAENRWNVQNLQNQMAVQPDPWMKALAGLGDTGMNLGGILGSQAVSRGFAANSFSSGGTAGMAEGSEQAQMMNSFNGGSAAAQSTAGSGYSL